MQDRAKRGRTLVLVILTVGVIGLVLWQALDLRSRILQTGDSTASSGLTLYPASRGVALPDVQGRTITNQTLSLSDFRGHVLVLNVWGSWCAPCRAEAPDLARISRATAAQGVRFVGIDTRDNPAAATAFEHNFGIRYPSFDDRNGLVLAQFTGIIPVSAVPSTLVVDREGVIRARVVGRIDPTTLRGIIHDTEASR